MQLPDIMWIAKANGWTSIRLGGGKKAAFLAAAAQVLKVEHYTPSKIIQAEADCRCARFGEREKQRAGKKADETKLQSRMELSNLKSLSERFLSQSHAENARDPNLRFA